jgi:putative ABC transport system ATP-binding protein
VNHTASERPLIELRDVTKTFGQGPAAFRALKGVSFDIADGEFVSVMGPSGSGKSTVMNIIGCLDVVSSGSYAFRGVQVENLDRRQRALLRRNQIGFVFQGFNLLARNSAVENVELPLVYRGVKTRERRAQAMRSLDLVGLARWARHTPSELSGGQQQRVAIARALVTDPAILLADEPTGNLDTERSLDIMRLLATLNRERGLTIMMVTHEAPMAAFSTRIIHFLDGVVDNDSGATELARAG